jgi:hypothetical protein
MYDPDEDPDLREVTFVLFAMALSMYAINWLLTYGGSL